MIERYWPYIQIEMRLITPLTFDDQLPNGYTYHYFKDLDDIAAWAMITQDTGEFDTVDAALKYFREEVDLSSFQKHEMLGYIENEKSEKIATGMVFFKDIEGTKYPKLHYISVLKAYQGRGLGKKLIAHLIKLSEKYYPQKSIYLTTQTWSHKAIGMYQSFGFEIIDAKTDQGVLVAREDVFDLLDAIKAQKQFLKNKNRPLIIGVVAPSSPADLSDVLKGKEKLEQLGFQVKLGISCTYEKTAYLAAPDDIRAKDIMDMFIDDQIDLIMCMKGGYGSPRMIDLLDYDVIRRHQKPFVGFSDVTLLLNTIYLKSGLITYHGPMVIGDFTYDFNKISYQSFIEVVLSQNVLVVQSYRSACTLREGIVKGFLLGGNLCLLDVLLHMTEKDTYKDAILLIEEVHEDIYRIDRLLQGMRLKGVFDVIKGIIFGKLTLPKSESEEDAKQMIKNICEPYDFPVLYDVPIGHIKQRRTLPIGGLITLDATNKTITIHKKVD